MGGTITYTYRGDSRTVQVTIPNGGPEYFDPNEVLRIRAIKGVTQLSFWGQKSVLSNEVGNDGDSMLVDWETPAIILNEIERL